MGLVDGVKENPITARCAMIGRVTETKSKSTTYMLGAEALKLPSYTPSLG